MQRRRRYRRGTRGTTSKLPIAPRVAAKQMHFCRPCRGFRAGALPPQVTLGPTIVGPRYTRGYALLPLRDKTMPHVWKTNSWRVREENRRRTGCKPCNIRPMRLPEYLAAHRAFAGVSPGVRYGTLLKLKTPPPGFIPVERCLATTSGLAGLLRSGSPWCRLRAAPRRPRPNFGKKASLL